MKNVVLKIGVAVIAAFVFIGGGVFVNAQNNINPMMYSDYGFNNMGYGNDFNKDSFKASILKSFFPGHVVGAGLVFLIFGLILLAFWVWMLVHAIKHDIDYKPVWILVLWFLNIFGAIIYYFAVKRECPCCQSYENVCICEGGVCKCGAINSNELKDLKEEIKD